MASYNMDDDNFRDLLEKARAGIRKGDLPANKNTPAQNPVVPSTRTIAGSAERSFGPKSCFGISSIGTQPGGRTHTSADRLSPKCTHCVMRLGRLRRGNWSRLGAVAFVTAGHLAGRSDLAGTVRACNSIEGIPAVVLGESQEFRVVEADERDDIVRLQRLCRE